MSLAVDQSAHAQQDAMIERGGKARRAGTGSVSFTTIRGRGHLALIHVSARPGSGSYLFDCVNRSPLADGALMVLSADDTNQSPGTGPRAGAFSLCRFRVKSYWIGTCVGRRSLVGRNQGTDRIGPLEASASLEASVTEAAAAGRTERDGSLIQVSVTPCAVRYTRRHIDPTLRHGIDPSGLYASEHSMQHSILKGRSILLVEDELLIAMDVTQELETAGASVIMTGDLQEALVLARNTELSGAILDHGLRDGDSSLLRMRLNERGVPFLNYSAYAAVEDGSDGSAHLSKPAAKGLLSAALADLINVHKRAAAKS
jgi:CheY-like chemotaxis protein